MKTDNSSASKRLVALGDTDEGFPFYSRFPAVIDVMIEYLEGLANRDRHQFMVLDLQGSDRS
jgi:hypothetical protein